MGIVVFVVGSLLLASGVGAGAGAGALAATTCVGGASVLKSAIKCFQA